MGPNICSSNKFPGRLAASILGNTFWESLDWNFSFLKNFKKFLKQSQSYEEVTFIGRTEAETPILWLPDVKSQLIRKDLYARKD